MELVGGASSKSPRMGQFRGQNRGQEEGEEDWSLYSQVSSLSFSSDPGFLGRGQAWCEGRDRIRTYLSWTGGRNWAQITMLLVGEEAETKEVVTPAQGSGYPTPPLPGILETKCYSPHPGGAHSCPSPRLGVSGWPWQGSGL